MSLKACLNPPFKLFRGNKLNSPLVDLTGTTFGRIEPQRFGFLLGQVLQAVQKAFDEFGALLEGQRQGLFFDGCGVHGLSLPLTFFGSNSKGTVVVRLTGEARTPVAPSPS